MFSPLQKRLNDAPWPEKAINWPQSRTLNDYIRLLLRPWSLKDLSEASKLSEMIVLLSLAWCANKPTVINDPDDFLAAINPEGKPIIVDVGMGDGNALRELKDLEGFITVGFGLHEVKPANAEAIDVLCYSPVPNGRASLHVFNALRGKVSLVLEAFGSSTYAAGESNPIESLIFIGELLAPGGTAKIIVSSILEEDEQQSPLGFAVNRDQLSKFFKQHLGLSLIISRSYIKSLVSSGTQCIDYHVEIKRDINAQLSDKPLPLKELFELVKREIGECSLLIKRAQVGEFGGFGIRGRTYTREGEVVQSSSLNMTECIENGLFQWVEERYPAFTFNFKSAEAKNDFIIRFSEYYLNNHGNQEWRLDPAKDTLQLTVTYKPIQENTQDIKKQARKEIKEAFPCLNRQLKGLFQFYNSKPLDVFVLDKEEEQQQGIS